MCTMQKGWIMITIKRDDDGSYDIVSGATRLQEQLEAFGLAEVLDLDNGRTLVVHEFGDRIFALSREATVALERLADHVIDHARQH